MKKHGYAAVAALVYAMAFATFGNAEPAKSLVGNWLQPTTGDQMAIGSDNSVVQNLSADSATTEIHGVLQTGASEGGGNMSIRLSDGRLCNYRATILRDYSSVNLQLLNEVGSGNSICVHGKFERAEKWPEAGEKTATNAQSNQQSTSSPDLAVSSVQIDNGGSSNGPFSGTVFVKWSVANEALIISVPFSGVKSLPDAEKTAIAKVLSYFKLMKTSK